MSKNLKFILFTFLFFIGGIFLLAGVCLAVNSIDDIEISPALDITRFAPYKFLSTITGSPTSVSVDLSGINGQLGPEDPMRWNYYVDGTPVSETQTKTMTYNATSGKWESPNVYPDSLYPEIFFADSNVTWYNTPANQTLQRNSYQMLHFANPFTMVGDMSFFVEVNAVPRATNSADLLVYLVKKGKTNVFFQSDWRSSADVELVGTINSADNLHHAHTDNSGHHLIALTANNDGTIGAKNLDVSGDFWVVLYSQSPNNTRGWDFRYQTSCDGLNRWYQGSQAGWTTTLQTAGCPDSHIHMARRDALISDGAKAVVTATFEGGGTVTSNETYYFATQPNLAPNQTSFISPITGGIYNGDGTDQIPVSWNPATDPNNDPLLYSIYLLDSNDVVLDTLVTNTANTSFTWDISGVSNGIYRLKGIITENIALSPLSTEFFMDGTFTINKTLTTYTLSSVSISSNNATSSAAKAGDVVTISFTASGVIATPTVAIYSGGTTVTNSVTVTNSSENNWTATYAVSALDLGGAVSFEITSTNLNQTYSDTTDASSVVIDVTEPADVVATPDAGTYSSAQIVVLSSIGSNTIKYTTNGIAPTCSTGTLYEAAIAVSSPTTIKAIACDTSGNDSAVASFSYVFQYTVTFDGNGGSGHSPATATVVHGNTTSLPTEPTRTGYTFTSWNTQAGGGGTTFDASTVVISDLSVYAQWTINNYTLTYFGNGNDGGEAPAATNNNYGTSVVLSNAGTLTKAGYTFYGWNSVANGSGTGYATGSTLVISGDVNLYAQWLEDAKCTVTFNGNGGSGQTPGAETINCGASLSGSARTLPSNPSQTGYAFSAWNTASNGSGDAFTVDTVINGNITVYAQWTGNSYTVTFAPQGGVVDPATLAVVYGSAVGVLPTPTKAGYGFASWNSSADGTGTTYSAITVYSTASNITLYAQWSGSTYTITFDAQGGTVDPGTKSVTYASAVGALPTPTKGGYTFVSWNSVAAGTGTTYTASTSYAVVGNITLYAQWTATVYILGFNSQGGSTSATQSVTYNSAIGALPTPTRTGYTFSGWFNESSGAGTQFTANTIYDIQDNYFLFANWTIINYALTYTAGTGGTINGDMSQSIPYSSDGASVTAVPLNGYSFVSWSDDSTENPRTDTNITANSSFAAIFAVTPTHSGYSPPPSTGDGQVDSTIPMNESKSIGEVTTVGINVLAYINSSADFSAVVSGTRIIQNHDLNVLDVDMVNRKIKIEIKSDPIVFDLRVGQLRKIDLDQDGLDDIAVACNALVVNRVDLTIKQLSFSEVVPAIKYAENSLLKEIGKPTVYLIKQNKKRPFFNEQAFLTNGYFWKNIKEVSSLASITLGDIIYAKKDNTTPIQLGCEFRRDLFVGMSGQDVKSLQKYLNNHGFLLANSGLGAPGNETNYFGKLTQIALSKFQKAHNIFPPIGYFGTRTRGVVCLQ
jgi:uncharacterized repeat protein (TIGR02543 family)